MFDVQSGTSVFFVGANGSGKTRLAVRIEQSAGDQSHRISGHRSLELDPQIAKISEESATLGLRFGVASVGAHLAHRENSRWGSKGAIKLLNDYSFLIQLLFAEQSNTSLVSHKNSRANNGIPALPTKFEKLAEIFDKILPHRKLHVTGDDIKVQANNISQEYSASDMSDGERSVFYLIGQTLVAQPNSLLIFDEPELHIHRSILSRLWDELEAARPYCAFIVISHDLEFVASRNGKKYFLREFLPLTGWTIEEVPQETGFPEDIVTLILGSRKPILFVEGTNSSLDMAIYRACYPEWTIVPRGSHDQVIRAVNTMRANSALTRVTCAGIIDCCGEKIF